MIIFKNATTQKDKTIIKIDGNGILKKSRVKTDICMGDVRRHMITTKKGI